MFIFADNVYGFVQQPVTNYCPAGYTNMGGITCLAIVEELASWPIAYATCKSNANGSLVGFPNITSTSYTLPLIQLYVKLENALKVWTGDCLQGWY